MKKQFYLLLATILIMGLAACGGSQNASVDTGDAVDEETYEVIATLQINTDGMGAIAYGIAGEDVEFDEDYPKQSAVVNLTEPDTYMIKAKPDDGWKFVKWTKDGEDFSEEADITVEVTADVEYIAGVEAE